MDSELAEAVIIALRSAVLHIDSAESEYMPCPFEPVRPRATLSPPALTSNIHFSRWHMKAKNGWLSTNKNTSSFQMAALST
jgi:hypothetical protein